MPPPTTIVWILPVWSFDVMVPTGASLAQLYMRIAYGILSPVSAWYSATAKRSPLSSPFTSPCTATIGVGAGRSSTGTAAQAASATPQARVAASRRSFFGRIIYPALARSAFENDLLELDSRNSSVRSRAVVSSGETDHHPRLSSKTCGGHS